MDCVAYLLAGLGVTLGLWLLLGGAAWALGDRPEKKKAAEGEWPRGCLYMVLGLVLIALLLAGLIRWFPGAIRL